MGRNTGRWSEGKIGQFITGGGARKGGQPAGEIRALRPRLSA